MSCEITPDPADILAALRREHGGQQPLLRQASQGLAILAETPYSCSKRIRKLSGNIYYRYGTGAAGSSTQLTKRDA